MHHLVGGNFRIDTLQAAILRAKLPHLTAWNVARRKHAEHYLQRLQGTPLGLPEAHAQHVWHHFVVRVSDGKRDALREHLKERLIETEVYYPLPLHLQPCFQALGYKPGDMPEAERAANEVLALPVHAQLAPAQLEHVVTSVREFFA